MNKAIFFIGLSIILLQIVIYGGYMLAQQNAKFIETLVLVIVVGGINLAAVIMMFVGLFKEEK